MNRFSFFTKLQDDHIELLESLPEQGMGYQIINIEMNDGTMLNNRVVVESSHIVLSNSETIDTTNIKSISIAKH